jgi:hypothetical protein
MGGFYTKQVLGKFLVGAVSQVVDGRGKLLQGFSDELDHSLQLRVGCCFQVVVTVVVLKRLSNLVVRRSSRGARMLTAGSFKAAIRYVAFWRGTQ